MYRQHAIHLHSLLYRSLVIANLYVSFDWWIICRTSALRLSGAALPDDMRTRLVEEENLRLQERVMQLEAQLDLIVNRTNT